MPLSLGRKLSDTVWDLGVWVGGFFLFFLISSLRNFMVQPTSNLIKRFHSRGDKSNPEESTEGSFFTWIIFQANWILCTFNLGFCCCCYLSSVILEFLLYLFVLTFSSQVKQESVKVYMTKCTFLPTLFKVFLKSNSFLQNLLCVSCKKPSNI